MTAARDRAADLDRIQAHLHAGAPWAACDVFRDAVAASVDDGELLYWGALAHARSGAHEQARVLLERAQASGTLSVPLRQEALSLSGRLWKDRVDRGPGEAPRTEFIDLARSEYLAAYALARDPYPGINAATMAVLGGDVDEAHRLARDILATLAARGDGGPWAEATAGEANLLLDRRDEARARYAEACRRAGRHAGDVAAMRRQLRLLAHVLPHAEDMLDVLPTASVVAFSGHMADRPGQATPRFPPHLEAAVADALAAKLRALHLPVVYTSAACGADLLFIEAALDLGAEVNVVLPFDRADFVATSVAIGGDRWIPRFERALERVDRVILATDEGFLGDVVLFEHAMHLLEGLAVLRASQLQGTPTMLCVLDRNAEWKPAGTRASYDRWMQRHAPPDVIDLRALRERHPDPSTPTTTLPAPDVAHATAVDRPHRTIRVPLFADFAGFGRLHDAYAPLFHARFLGIVADQIRASATAPLTAHTWGDALYLVFDTPDDGADFALGLLDRMLAVDWVEAGLSETSQIRIALHAGPVFKGYDPIVARDNYFGSEVTKAARIEPVTPPGVVYASEAFVAMVSAAGSTRHRFEYLGNLDLAKQYGPTRIYRAMWR